EGPVSRLPVGRRREHPYVETRPQGRELSLQALGQRQAVTRPADHEQAPHRAASWSTASMRPKISSRPYAATEAAAASASRSRSPGSVVKRTIAAASASTSLGGTSKPLTPSSTTSATPPTRVPITGVPTASDSTTVWGKFSHFDDSSVASAARNSSSTP